MGPFSQCRQDCYMALTATASTQCDVPVLHIWGWCFICLNGQLNSKVQTNTLLGRWLGHFYTLPQSRPQQRMQGQKPAACTLLCAENATFLLLSCHSPLRQCGFHDVGCMCWEDTCVPALRVQGQQPIWLRRDARLTMFYVSSRQGGGCFWPGCARECVCHIVGAIVSSQCWHHAVFFCMVPEHHSGLARVCLGAPLWIGLCTGQHGPALVWIVHQGD